MPNPINFPNQPSDPFAQVKTRFAHLNSREDLAQATFAGGCFWCMEAPFKQLEGVVAVIAGYTSGSVPNPTYEQVSSGQTGHREGVQIFYHPDQVKYQKLLDVYWLQIDPSDPGGQFSDRGDQYKTAIYYHNKEQKQLAEQSKQQLNQSGKYEHPIVTEILPFKQFYPAEDYHQNFYQQSPARYHQYKIGSGRQDYIQNIKGK